MMPTPLFVLALQAARKARPEDKPASNPPKDRRSSIRLVWDAAAKPADRGQNPNHTKER